MTAYQSFAMLDWSGGNDTGPRPRRDAIWLSVIRDGREDRPLYLRNRALAEAALAGLIEEETAAGRRLLIGVDFPFGYPAGFARALTGQASPLAVWDWLEARVEDAARTNNRFDLAGEINRALGGGAGPFWGNALSRDIAGLPRTRAGYVNPFPERREVEERAKGAFTCWQLAGAGAVGSQMLMGLPVLARLRRRFAGQIAVWPFEPLAGVPVALVEIWPSLLRDAVARDEGPDDIRDAVQVRVMARALSRLAPGELAEMLAVKAPEEGWIFGLGHVRRLEAAAETGLRPPPLANDCFALPAGVNWTPVDVALARLQSSLRPVVPVQETGLSGAEGRALASDVTARRANPPQPNTAVDGYGFAAASLGRGAQRLPLVAGRAAAGAPFAGNVPPGHALRILTGAALPRGVDTVVLEEDVTRGAGEIAFDASLKPGANTRRAGEDVQAGDVILRAGRCLTPADLALAAATGHARLPVRARLRVAVISTGDELREPGDAAGPGQIFDANRPMLLAMLRKWGFDSLDLGRIPDDRTALRRAFDRAAAEAHAVLTSGGASAGDEDHVSALLRESGSLQNWRIALKPGRPLALAVWGGVPVFGLPGNPVAAMVCTLVFARPALMTLAGMGWRDPQGFDVPAGFSKAKKPGRREYLRARIRDGRAEVFASEGSGRISGLGWAEGLVELDDGPREIRPGDMVRYLPFGSFGL